MRTAGFFIAGISLGCAVICAVVYSYFATGRAPVAASDREMPFEALLMDKAVQATVRREEFRGMSLPGDSASLTAAADLYRANCALCHGVPAGGVSAVASGMYPPPPQLFRQSGRTYRGGETYWKIAHGVGRSGMPGFQQSLSAREIRELTALLARARALPPPVVARLNGASPGSASGKPQSKRRSQLGLAK